MLEKLSIFGFRAMWSPLFFIFIVAIGIIYIMAVKGYFKKLRSPNEEAVTKKQMFLFILSLFILYIVKGSPVDLLGHLNFSIHMVQMSVLYLFLPPLFMISIPNWIWRKIITFKMIQRPFNFFTKPLIALLVFNTLFSLYHFPFIFDIVKTNIVLHATVTVLIFIAAFIMWWPLVCPLPEYRQLSGLQKLGYIFADGVLLTPACALIIFADTALYETYTNHTAWLKALELCVPSSMLAAVDIGGGPQMFSWLSPKNDQQLGGVIMKIMQEISYGITLGYVFFQWVREEKKKEQQQTTAFPSPQPSK
ncbi:cytochrome c oxidase assembly factor CtaG [Calidifontibacillus erzurumensis]|uniref:Cytochrome c oxidase assembly factor CtaG n=1 Tax=Calidifontibacillus erzurumensis TaxID=2741433 RepID=A0A8J8GFA0_9BACI|nr:cytochrome c oxidase assembly factor CtaG [Calidifontibacillus erzurumensis]NSL50746.1 cytochrome c oxidase assembly factor CtaG [Calidifontibacillus erzurumensis]